MPYIGKDLARKVLEMIKMGNLSVLEQARARVPQGLIEHLGVPGLGPKYRTQE